MKLLSAKSMTCPRCGTALDAADLLHHPPADPRASRALDRRYCPKCGVQVGIRRAASGRQQSLTVLAVALYAGALLLGLDRSARVAMLLAALALGLVFLVWRPAAKLVEVSTPGGAILEDTGLCPACRKPICFAALPYDPESSRALDRRVCPHCGAILVQYSPLGRRTLALLLVIVAFSVGTSFLPDDARSLALIAAILVVSLVGRRRLRVARPAERAP